MNTPYHVLGVSRRADEKTIRTAFRKAAKSHHPDLNAGNPVSEQQFRQVIAAYQLLKNPQLREAYDLQLRIDRRARVRRLAAPFIVGLMSGGIVAAGLVLWSTSSAPEPPQTPRIVVAAEEPPSPPAAVVVIDMGSAAESAAADKSAPDDLQTQQSASLPPNAGEPEGGAPPTRESTPVLATDNPAPATPSKSLEERATGFVAAQISAWSSIDARNLNALTNAYASEVLYNGSLKPRLAVLREKRRLLEQWPERAYLVLPGSIKAECIANVCRVGGIMEWQTRNPARAASASGTSQFEYGIVLSAGEFNILSENGTAVQR